MQLISPSFNPAGWKPKCPLQYFPLTLYIFITQTYRSPIQYDHEVACFLFSKLEPLGNLCIKVLPNLHHPPSPGYTPHWQPVWHCSIQGSFSSPGAFWSLFRYPNSSHDLVLLAHSMALFISEQVLMFYLYLEPWIFKLSSNSRIYTWPVY